MARASRNDPCPCGSGRKYKRCCLAKDEAAAAPPPTDDLDLRVGMAVATWVKRRDPEGVERARAAMGGRTLDLSAGEAIGFLTSLCAYEITAPGGRRWVEEFRAEEGTRMRPEEQRYLDAQVESWFSVWEVVTVDPGVGFVLQDLLTGEERDVRERTGSANIAVRHALCGRIVKRDLRLTYGAGSPFILRPREAQEAVDEFRRLAGTGRRRLMPENLRGEPALLLAKAWGAAVERGFEPKAPPRMENTDGDPLLLVADRYWFPAPRRGEVLAALARIPGAEMPGRPEAEEMPAVVSLTRPGNALHKSWSNTIVAHVRVAEDHLAVETNSLRRAEAARAVVEGVLGRLAQHAGRTEETRAQAAERAGREPTPRKTLALPAGERARLVREVKERQYATWPDEPVPLLGGLTPREVAKHPRRREYAELDLILREIEHFEAGQPEGERFDVRGLREELGLGP